MGDLIIWKPKTNNNKIDGVAILIKLQKKNKDDAEEIYILQIGDLKKQDVVLSKWSKLMTNPHFQNYDYYYRHLYCNRDDKFVDKSMEFIKKFE